MIRAVFFDIGETILDETRFWVGWADWLGVPGPSFFAALGSVIERGEHHRRVFPRLCPGFDFERELGRRRAAGFDESILEDDLYADVRPCLEALCGAGYRVGLVGNQPRWVEAALRKLHLSADLIASSEGWGVEKPEPRFFERVAEAAGCSAGEVAYVGDRLDNDVLPARRAGLVAVFLRRGPWGVVHATRSEVEQAHIRLESLADLLAALRRYDRETR